MADQDYDTEITLGVGKLLGLFVMLVILCGIFLGLGYSLGRSAAKDEAKAAVGSSEPTAAKPDVTPLKQEESKTQDLNYDKAVEQKEPDQQLQKPAPSTTDPPPFAEMRVGGGYVVQVAAVSKKEDAEALQQALQKKQYPVVVTPGAADKLFHVQIGPFADLKDADAMKSRLANDGYNAIVKR